MENVFEDTCQRTSKLIENLQFASKKLFDKKLIDQKALDKYFRSS